MNMVSGKTAFKFLTVFLIASLLVAAACTEIKTNTQVFAAAAEPAGTGSSPGLKEVFDSDKYKGLLTVRYLHLSADVAAGDAIVIQTPDGKTAMIDSGLMNTGSQVVDYLDKLGINTIDMAINTHPHPDHIGGFGDVALYKDIKKVYMENLPAPQWVAYSKVMNIFQEKNIPYEFLEEGDTFQLGDLKFEVLSPQKGALPNVIENLNDDAEVNNNSLVIRMTYKENTFLFTADIYKSKETELVKKYGARLKADVMHVPHHGWRTSSSPDFIPLVSPKVAVVSNNLFDNTKLVQRFDKQNIKTVVTGTNGNILITSNGKNVNVITEK
ncbi:ComEC/Rec2 family competence protein [Paenibacillus foliorum]|nr:MBL fold metallo-hydrolase [Paenibacillus foliorum]